VTLALLFAGLTQEYYRDAENAQLWWFCTALGVIGILKNKKAVEVQNNS
jgi:hypothetical protein